jgi:hypothetical protein
MNTLNRIRKALATNSTASSFASILPTSTDPSTSGGSAVDGYFDLPALGMGSSEKTPEWLHIQPYLVGANNDTCAMRVYGWSPINPSTGSIPNVANIWVPTLLAQIAITAGNIAGTPIAANTFMADTLVATYGGDDVNLISPANDVPGSLLLHLRGFHTIQFDFSKNAGTPTSMNALWKPVGVR